MSVGLSVGRVRHLFDDPHVEPYGLHGLVSCEIGQNVFFFFANGFEFALAFCPIQLSHVAIKSFVKQPSIGSPNEVFRVSFMK